MIGLSSDALDSCLHQISSCQQLLQVRADVDRLAGSAACSLTRLIIQARDVLSRPYYAEIDH